MRIWWGRGGPRQRDGTCEGSGAKNEHGVPGEEVEEADVGGFGRQEEDVGGWGMGSKASQPEQELWIFF